MLAEKVNERYSHIRIPGIVATEKGTLIRYCECRRSYSDWADIDLKVSRSIDGGESWTDVLLIESCGNTLNNPVAFVCQDSIQLLYCKNYKEIYRKVSFDDGKTFGESRRVNFESSVDFFYNAVAVGPGHGIFHKGRMIVPIWFAHSKIDEKAHWPSKAGTLYSDDGGESWSVGEMIYPDGIVCASECALAVTADDKVIISMRHTSPIRTRILAISEDGASNWEMPIHAHTLPDPICMGSMTHRDGRIYHINCASKTDRVNLTVKISDDCFKTTRDILVSERGGYSDIALLGDEICVFYEKTNESGAFELYFEKIHIFGEE